MAVFIDVFQYGPEVLRRLRKRFYNKISPLERRRLCHEMCRQALEKFRENRATIPRAECGHDAIRTTTRSMIPRAMALGMEYSRHYYAVRRAKPIIQYRAHGKYLGPRLDSCAGQWRRIFHSLYTVRCRSERDGERGPE